MNHHNIVYDGDCGVCDWFKSLVERLDVFKKFRFFPLQDKSVYLSFPAISKEQCEKEIVIISSKGVLVSGGDAVVYIFMRLPALMPLGLIMWLYPFRWLVRSIYVWFAKNRYKISSTCGLDKKVP